MLNLQDVALRKCNEPENPETFKKEAENPKTFRKEAETLKHSRRKQKHCNIQEERRKT